MTRAYFAIATYKVDAKREFGKCVRHFAAGANNWHRNSSWAFRDRKCSRSRDAQILCVVLALPVGKERDLENAYVEMNDVNNGVRAHSLHSDRVKRRTIGKHETMSKNRESL